MRVESRIRRQTGRPAYVDVHVDLEGRSYLDMANVTEDALKQLLDGNGWVTRKLPGHRSNTGGPDLVAYRFDPYTSRFQLRILDNKATHWANRQPGRAVSKAGGLSARSLSRTLFPLVKALRQSSDPRDKAAVIALNRVRRAAVTAARTAAAGKTTRTARKAAAIAAPVVLKRGPDVRIAVTNVGGRSSGVTSTLQKRGIEHIPWHLLEVQPW